MMLAGNTQLGTSLPPTLPACRLVLEIHFPFQQLSAALQMSTVDVGYLTFWIDCPYVERLSIIFWALFELR